MGDEKDKSGGRSLRNSKKEDTTGKPESGKPESGKPGGDCCSGSAAILNEIKTLNQSLNQKIDHLQTAMENNVNTKVDGLRVSLEKIILENNAAIKKDLEKAVFDMSKNLDTEVGILCARMGNIEQKIAERAVKSFDPEVSLIVFGLHQTEGENLMAKVKDLLHSGLGCDASLYPVAVERLQARGDLPGLVKVQMGSVDEKVWVLRKKSKLRDVESFGNVYVSSAKTHAERLVELNFRTLLRESPAGKNFYVSQNGRLMKKTRPPREGTRSGQNV